MDAKQHVLKDTISPLEQFLDDQQNCPLCGSELLLTHVTQFVHQEIKEQAECEACRIMIRNQNHLLQ